MHKMHFIQMILVIIIISLTGARVAIKPSGMPVTRSDTMGIVMVGWTSKIPYAYQLRMANSVMIGCENVGGALVPTHNDVLYQAPTLAKSQGIPNPQYHGDPLLVCGCNHHFHGHLAILPKYILRSELVDRPDCHHFDVCVAFFSCGLIRSSCAEPIIRKHVLTPYSTLAFWTAVVSRHIRTEAKQFQ